MKLGIPLILIVFIVGAQGAFAQGGDSLFNPGGKSKRDKSIPTVINSDSMDIQTAKNIAVFTGNVKVKDQELTINCHKMTIFLEDKTPAAKAPAGGAGKPKTEPAGTSGDQDKESKGGKKISRILCEGDVVINRKYVDDKNEEKEQQATAGKAEYDLRDQKITLSDNPALLQGTDKVVGETIVLFRDTERVIIQGGAAINVSPDTLETEPEQ